MKHIERKEHPGAGGGARARWTAFVLSILLLATGCYHQRVAPPNLSRATEPQTRTVWSTVWGGVQQNISPDNCQGNGLAEVTVSTNFGFVLLTVVSLGFAAPVTLEWTCTKDINGPGTGGGGF